ncbi:hypothetical protein [Lignipirellula cremea]|nr:hypothetical protein [Lignipirellula cremea]
MLSGDAFGGRLVGRVRTLGLPLAGRVVPGRIPEAFGSLAAAFEYRCHDLLPFLFRFRLTFRDNLKFKVLEQPLQVLEGKTAMPVVELRQGGFVDTRRLRDSVPRLPGLVDGLAELVGQGGLLWFRHYFILPGAGLQVQCLRLNLTSYHFGSFAKSQRDSGRVAAHAPPVASQGLPSFQCSTIRARVGRVNHFD